MQIVELISEERLETYEKIALGRKQAIALHSQTLQLGSSLMAAIALFELALRNATNKHLIDAFGDSDWLLPEKTAVPLQKFERTKVSAAQSNARKASYAKLNPKQKRDLDTIAFPGVAPPKVSRKSRIRARRATLRITHGQIVAQTTLFFWKRLYSSDYEDTLWKPALKKVFPNKRLKRGQVSDALEHVYSTRNRVAHHEPVFEERLENAMKSLSFLRDTFNASREGADSAYRKFSKVQHLRLQMDYEAFKVAWDTLT